MAFEHHPPHVRRKIALGITSLVGVALVALLIAMYSTKQAKGTSEPTSRLRNFYNTILTTGQSYFDGN